MVFKGYDPNFQSKTIPSTPNLKLCSRCGELFGKLLQIYTEFIKTSVSGSYIYGMLNGQDTGNVHHPEQYSQTLEEGICDDADDTEDGEGADEDNEDDSFDPLAFVKAATTNEGESRNCGMDFRRSTRFKVRPDPCDERVDGTLSLFNGSAKSNGDDFNWNGHASKRKIRKV